jgi:hypothetical protein
MAIEMPLYNTEGTCLHVVEVTEARKCISELATG